MNITSSMIGGPQFYTIKRTGVVSHMSIIDHLHIKGYVMIFSMAERKCRILVTDSQLLSPRRCYMDYFG